jgi:hypothetical protein
MYKTGSNVNKPVEEPIKGAVNMDNPIPAKKPRTDKTRDSQITAANI